MTKDMEQFLRNKYSGGSGKGYAHFEMPPRIHYRENVNPDAINGDAWLDNDTSYIWKVGVLVCPDANKCDWVHVLLATQREPGREPEFIGELFFSEGENDDCGKVLKRMCEMLPYIHPVFADLETE